ncbi:MAG TPA: hypothetical protein VGG90_12530 [Candidatus Dormibacteraeota bacterium]
MSANAPVESQGAVESIDRSLQRLDQLFLWGHWTDEKYRAERERLEQMAKRARGVWGGGRIEPTLTDIVSAWDAGDAATRRELLAALFSDIHVQGGRVVGYTPRPDRATQVTRMVEAVRSKVSVSGGR